MNLCSLSSAVIETLCVLRWFPLEPFRELWFVVSCLSRQSCQKKGRQSVKNAAQNIFKEVCTFSWTLTSLDALQISFVSTNTFSLVFSLLWTATCPPSKVFLCCTLFGCSVLFNLVPTNIFSLWKITVLVVPHWKELSTIRFEKKAGVNAGFASRMVAHKEHEILKNPIYTVLIRVHL